MTKKQNFINKNVIYNVGYRILVLVMPLITVPYVSRVLGADNIGIYSYTQAFANYFVIFAMLGVANYGNRSIAQVSHDKEKTSQVFWEIYLFQFALACVLTILYVMYICIFESENKTIYFCQTFYIISAAFDVTWFFFGIENFKQTLIRNFVIKLLSLVAIFLLVKSKSDLEIYTLIMAVSIFLGQIILWPFLFKYIKFKRVTLLSICTHIKPNFILFIPVIANSIYNIMDKLMLGTMGNTIEVAYYANAEKIAAMSPAIIVAIGNALMPRMSSLIANGEKEVSKEIFCNSLRFIIGLSMLATFGLLSISLPFSKWFFGNGFETCGIYIAFLCPMIIFQSISGNIRTQLIIPMGKDYIHLYSVIAGAMVNLVANYLFIPRYGGMGAIFGTLLAEIAVLIIQLILTWKYINYKIFVKEIIVYFVIGMVMYCLIHNIDLHNNFETVVARMVVGGLIFVILFLMESGMRRKLKKKKVKEP